MRYVNSRQKTIFFRRATLFCVCVILAGCADSTLINHLTGEPPPGPMANRAGVLRVDSREALWPNLASVPPRPAPMPARATRMAEREALEKERQQALAILEARGKMPESAASAP